METERIALSQRERDRLRVSSAAALARTRRPGGDPWITRTAVEPQLGGSLRTEDLGAGTPALCGFRTHAGRRTLGPGRVVGEPRDVAEMDDQGSLVAPSFSAGKDRPCVARAESQFRRVGHAG